LSYNVRSYTAISAVLRSSESYIGGYGRCFLDKNTPSFIPIESVELHRAYSEVAFSPFFFLEIIDMRLSLGIKEHHLSTRESQDPPLLWNLLLRFRYNKASDSRDKIYEFLGLPKEFIEDTMLKSSLRLVPDYIKSVRGCILYVDSAKFLLSSAGDLECLSLKEDESITNIRDLPSWAPDFTSFRHPTLNYGP
jgi:hypothetical protein